ncbi:N-acetyltransferase [Hyphomicrobium sp.]|uniref:GNAT family N-acetyltransferase n=1 Tax=Hyphomicrobium sp. TaxID=82 RepID=UPI002E344696|nr:N-acetyltransferase [Hyphomicrobium sp.]HEX2843059.1 N-acetyltransferase [Hyphomicrobium sp.]
MTGVAIRSETPDLYGAIRAVLLQAFPSPVEADLVERLRADSDIEIGLAAIDGQDVIGHLVFSPMSAPVKALGLGPVAVAADRQGQGIGSLLISRGLERARAAGWEAVFVLGEPEYYARFGFSTATASGFSSPYAGPYFMALSLSGRILTVSTGRVDYAAAFQAIE